MDLQRIHNFLRINTPKAWLDYAVDNIPLLLIDHAHCERKAAATAVNMISKYPEREELVALMSPLAREELLHFEKVIQCLQKRNITYIPLQASNYATTMHKQVTRKNNNDRLVDQLLVGAIIEARSCERFYALIPYLEKKDQELAHFYKTLLKSEARHFEEYLQLANLYTDKTEKRLELFLSIEHEFILAKDEQFRFHSGIP